MHMLAGMLVIKDMDTAKLLLGWPSHPVHSMPCCCTAPYKSASTQVFSDPMYSSPCSKALRCSVKGLASTRMFEYDRRGPATMKQCLAWPKHDGALHFVTVAYTSHAQLLDPDSPTVWTSMQCSAPYEP